MVGGVLGLRGRRRLILVALLLGAFAAIALALPDKGGMALDIVVANWLRDHSTDAGDTIFTWVSWLGDTALSGLLCAAVVILVHRRRWNAAATVALATLGGMLLDIALKRIFHRGRPEYAIEFITGLTWSFPSGHAMASLVGFGIVAYFRRERERSARRRLWILVTTCLVVAAVGFSRLYLGVHYLSDVVGGFLAGAVWLLACLEVYHYRSSHRSDLVHGD
jgi:membrane-associated phospholipid phosphatase